MKPPRYPEPYQTNVNALSVFLAHLTPGSTDGFSYLVHGAAAGLLRAQHGSYLRAGLWLTGHGIAQRWLYFTVDVRMLWYRLLGLSEEEMDERFRTMHSRSAGRRLPSARRR